MTTEDKIKSHTRSLERVQKIIDGLYRKHLENKAWIIALRESLEDIMAAQPKKTRQTAERAIKNRQKAVLQILLERVENRSPQIAADIDHRNIEDVLGEE